MLLRILVIDDDPAVRASIAHALRSFGVVDQAGDGVAGLQAFREALVADSAYHLVTIDLQMPQIGGQVLLECMRGLELLRAARHKAKCVMVTGESARNVILETLRTGADAYLCKPIQPEDLQSRVRDLFGRQATEGLRSRASGTLAP